MLRVEPNTPLRRDAERLARQVLAAVEREGGSLLEEVHLFSPKPSPELRRAISEHLVSSGLDGVDVRLQKGPTPDIAKCCFAPTRTP